MRDLRRLAVVALAVVSLVLPTAVSSAEENAISGEYTFDITATEALVNSAGGLFVAGDLSCSQATIRTARRDAVRTARMNGMTDAHHAVVDGGAILVNVNWVATQYVGRTKAITARYDSGIASYCYGFEGGPPYEWRTMYAYPVGGDQWVYSDNGRFSAGRIHIEILATGIAPISVYDAEDNWLITYDALFYMTNGWDLRAERYRTG